MKKTSNYQLNQWDPDDRVLRTDFNADNAKIDAAIKVQADAIAAERSARISAVSAEASTRASEVQAARDACPLVLLRSETLSASADRYDLSLRGIDWEKYGEVVIYMSIHAANSAANLTVLLNGVSTQGSYYISNGSTAASLAEFRIDEPQGATAICRIIRSAIGFQTIWWHTSTYNTFPAWSKSTRDSRSSFTSMNFCGGLAAGSRFTILGVRG